MKFTALVPLKANSQRIPRKNFILLAGKPLFWHIFETLKQVPLIDRIVCWSSDEIFMDFLPEGVEFIKRPQYLDGDNIKARELFTKAAEMIETDYFVLSHATAPFIKPTSILKGIAAVIDEGFDSSFSVKEIKNYAWYDNKTLNYDLDNPPKTQDLKPVYYETSGFFIYKRELILNSGRRIGNNPKMIVVDDIEAIDIDEKSDLYLAKLLESELYKKTSPDFHLLQKKYSHIVLDMDGVMVDTLPLMEKAWEYSGGVNYAPFAKYKALIGFPFKTICKKLNIPENRIDDIKTKYFEFTKNNVNYARLYPEVRETLWKLKHFGLKISVVTSKEYDNAKNIIQTFQLPVDLLIAPGLKGYGGRFKPYGDPILYACLELKESVMNSIFIGDTLVDLHTAENAGIDFAYASWGYGKNVSGDFPELKHFKQLEILAR